ncbi:MAG: hypothetical protein Q7S35_03100 [Candidatus Limnocylindrales bacterium]|nr:hypothetical protein [Candidatus Limnocylindrales bacterium]
MARVYPAETAIRVLRGHSWRPALPSPRPALRLQLLALWLNFANGGTDWNQLVDTNGNGVPDTALSTVLTNAENIRLAAGSTRGQLLAMASILERINRPDG